jgi:potassium channel subfamily K
MLLSFLLLPFSRLFSPKRERNIGDTEEALPKMEKQQETLKGSKFRKNALNALFIPKETRPTPSVESQPLVMQTPITSHTTDQDISSQNETSDSRSTGVRLLPLLSSIFVPFSVLLAIPGFTEHWYIRTNSQHEVLDHQANPLFIEVMLGLSMACAVITNACLLLRLFEKMVKKMTITCIIALTVHGRLSNAVGRTTFKFILDVLNTTAIITFIIKTQKDDGFILGQAFWMTLCSTIAALATNVTLILDYWSTTDLERHSKLKNRLIKHDLIFITSCSSESGLTAKQRSLTIIIIVLLCYIAFGAVVHTVLLQLSFIDALYFTVVCIETVGTCTQRRYPAHVNHPQCRVRRH